MQHGHSAGFVRAVINRIGIKLGLADWQVTQQLFWKKTKEFAPPGNVHGLHDDQPIPEEAEIFAIEWSKMTDDQLCVLISSNYGHTDFMVRLSRSGQ